MPSSLPKRDAKPAEIEAGIEYLREEPLKEYEEGKKKEKEKEKEKPAAVEVSAAGTAVPVAAKPAPPAAATAEMPEKGNGMMAGMDKGDGTKKPEIKYEVSVWGRYAKVLLSSTEFLFIN